MSARKKQKVDGAEGASFQDYLPKLTTEFLEYCKERYGLTQASLDRLDHMITYNCSGGKFYRASIVISTTKALCEESGKDYKDFEHKAIVLGWCIEILQACFLVADDIMDASTTRRGKACWYKHDNIKMDAVNDSFILRSFMYFLINKHFQEDVTLWRKVEQLFVEVGTDTEIGQMLDLTSEPKDGRRGKEVLEGFNIDLYTKIVVYKTACYTFYLPVACGLLIMGCDGPKEMDTARDICMKLGKKFQIQDDYLDNFGDPKKIGKIGTDIQDHKCSWLCVQALNLMNPEQRAKYEAHYGSHDDADVKVIKKIYNELKLEDLYLKQEEESKQALLADIEAAKSFLPPQLFLPILEKIHLRQK